MARRRSPGKKPPSRNRPPTPRPTPGPHTLTAPAPNAVSKAADLSVHFARISKKTPRNTALEKAFLARKLHTLRTHPKLSRQQRTAAVARFSARLGGIVKRLPPVPGGVGYGMFFTDAFKTDFTHGTGICWDIICPNPPGGNVDTYLYLTATNRTALGVEALIMYNGQNDTSFRVFDWARYPAEPWQTNIPFASLTSYLMPETAHGQSYDTLMLTNLTFKTGSDQWRNQVLLWNQGTEAWELVYDHSYAATLAQQTGDWVGSWGPIVETFQDAYSGTERMGSLSTQMITRTASGWGAWTNLSGTQSEIRTDNKGFDVVFLDANHNWAVES